MTIGLADIAVMQFNPKAYLPCADSTSFVVVGDRPSFFCLQIKVSRLRLPNNKALTIFEAYLLFLAVYHFDTVAKEQYSVLFNKRSYMIVSMEMVLFQ